MKGFIIALRRARSEDSIVVILSEKSVQSYYRFFGARHSILQYGNLIDFEVEGEDGRFMPRLRSISQISFPWLYDRNRLSIWHSFIKLFEPHLRDAEELDSFYYELLIKLAKRWDRQNTKRLVCEGYIEILRYEGRVHPTQRCFVCEELLDEQISLMATLKPAHPQCLFAPYLDRSSFERYLESGATLHLDDEEVEQIYRAILKGL